MASPSGRACELMTNRWRLRGSRRRSPRSRAPSVIVAASGAPGSESSMASQLRSRGSRAGSPRPGPGARSTRRTRTATSGTRRSRRRCRAGGAGTAWRAPARARSHGAPPGRRASCSRTRASCRSGVTCTRVSVTKPMPGSCTSRASSSLSFGPNLIGEPGCSRHAHVRNSTSLRLMMPGSTASIASTTFRSSPLRKRFAARDGHHAKTGTLPEVLMLDFRHRDVERPQPILHAAQHHPLVLQRTSPGDVQLEGEQRDDHDQDNPRLTNADRRLLNSPTATTATTG